MPNEPYGPVLLCILARVHKKKNLTSRELMWKVPSPIKVSTALIKKLFVFCKIIIHTHNPKLDPLQSCKFHWERFNSVLLNSPIEINGNDKCRTLAGS